MFYQVTQNGIGKMSFQGKEFNPGMKQLVVNLKQYFDEKRYIKHLPADWAVEQTATGLRIGEATVRRIMAEYNKNLRSVPDSDRKDRGKPSFTIPASYRSTVRDFIRKQNLKGRYVSVEIVREYLLENHEVEFPSVTIWRTLKRWGFTYGVGKRRSALKERDYVILARRQYLRRKRLNRRKDGTFLRPEVYLDESYVNKNHSNQLTWYWDEDGSEVNKPSGKGERLIIVNAIMATGWVKGAELVFMANRKTGDYHGQMNWNNFSRWFETQLMPNMPEKSMIILDNAKYHNVQEQGPFSDRNPTKEMLRNWLSAKGIPWGQDMLKAELYELCKPTLPSPEYKLDKIAAKGGHVILRTPQYHPELQPIETCWGIAKNFIARNCDFTLKTLKKNLPKAFGEVTPKVCNGLIQKVIEREEEYWKLDMDLDCVQGIDGNEFCDKC